MPVFAGTAAADWILGSATADQIQGLDGNDTLYGSGGDDLLAGGKGDDVLGGGKGNDVYEVGSAGDQVLERENEGIDEVRAWVSYQLPANVETLILMGTGNIDSTGNSLDNKIVGNAGANVLDGGAGNDALSGGAGKDRLSGDAGIDRLSGGDGNDILDGGAGDDLMAGGKGDDIYHIDVAGDRVEEQSGEGLDEVQARISYVLGVNVENLILGGAGSINGTGNSLNNKIVGNAGANLLDGGVGNDLLNGAAGDDVLIGGKGDDLYYVDTAGDRVEEQAGEGIDTVQSWISYVLGANVENLTLVGVWSISGKGNEFNNRIIGNVGDNVLDGGDGDDVLAGGQGKDVYYIDSSRDRVVEHANGGIDEIRVLMDSVTIALGDNIENATLLSDGFVNAYGNGLNNRIVGGSGENQLNGGSGDDLLMGGGGDDNIIGYRGRDKVYAGSGSDEINIGIDELFDARNDIATGEIYDGGDGDDTLRVVGDLGAVIDLSVIEISGIENLFSLFNFTKLSASQISSFSYISASVVEVANGGVIDLSKIDVDFYSIKFSNYGNKLIIGSDLANVSSFTINCGSGDDVVIGAYRSVYGLEGNDEIVGGAFENVLVGGDGDDILRGEGDDDVLRGDKGKDTIEGGVGGDEFIYYGVDSGIDTIVDFSPSEDDELVFWGLLHGTFSYLGTASFTGSGNSEARFADEQVRVDADGNGTADITINLTGITAASQLHASDFVFS